MLLLQSLLEGTPSSKPEKHCASTSIMGCHAGLIRNKALPTFSIFQMPLYPPHLRLTKKAVQCLSQIILGLDTHACICETPLASHHKAPFHAESLDQETWSSHTPQGGAQTQILVLQLQLRLL